MRPLIERKNVGSNPTLSAICFTAFRGSSGVERLPEAQRGAGSIPALGAAVGSFSGRTSGSDPGNVGSTPTPTARWKVSGWSRTLSRKQLALTGSGVRFPHLPPQMIRLTARRQSLKLRIGIRILPEKAIGSRTHATGPVEECRGTFSP